MQNDPLNTVSIQQFIKQVKSADASQAKEIRLDIQNAKSLAFTLGLVMTRLNSDLEELLAKKQDPDSEVIEVNMDGGNSW